MTYSTDNIGLLRANTISTVFDSGDVNENTVNAYANLFYPHIWDNGGNTKLVSLTLDVLNKQELEEDTEDLPNKNWVNSDRLRNDLSTSKTIWVFKEAYHGVKKSRAISNAFCFGGQKLTFYIAPQGQSTGSVNGTWHYCKTTLTITATDIINNTNTVLYTFDDFQTAEDSNSRYFTWEVPAINDTSFAQYGLFGVVVLRVDVMETYYDDAGLTILSTEAIPNSNQSHLQLLIYSGAKEIIEVNGGDANILTSTPSYTDTLEQIFSKTVFESLQSLNQNALTNSQKRAIIADQIAVLFISQHPVVNADFYPAKVLGFGALQAVIPHKVVNNIITYGKQYPDIVDLVKDRLFGMFATYKYFDISIDIESVISDYLQSSQIIKDPVRTILVDSDGVISEDLGVDGLIFNPYTMEVSNVETILDYPSEEAVDVPLYDGLVDVQNITITDVVDEDLIPTDNEVKVSFDVVWGSGNIEAIRYSIWAYGCKDYQTYLSSSVSSRSHIFNLIGNVGTQQLITAQIDIEDYTGAITSFVGNQFIQDTISYPYLYDLKIYQRNDGSDIVDIYYTYENVSEIENSYVYIQFSIDGGVTWSTDISDVSTSTNTSSSIITTSLRGDFKYNVMPGRRRVFWQPSIDLNNVTVTHPILCRITLYDIDVKKAVGNTLTGALVYDLVKPEIAVVKSNVKYVSEVTPTILNPSTTYTLDGSLSFEYTGEKGTTATIILNGQSFVVGNIIGLFVWDIGGSGEHIFTYDGEELEIIVGYNEYTITFNGIASLLFSVRLDGNLSSSSSSSSSYSSSSSSSIDSSSSSSSLSSSSVSSESSLSSSSNSSSSNSSSSVSSESSLSSSSNSSSSNSSSPVSSESSLSSSSSSSVL